MSDPSQPSAPPPAPNPPSVPPPPPRVAPPPRPQAAGGALLGCAFALSLLLNLVALGCFVLLCLGLALFRGGSSLNERHYAGDSGARDKVAVIHLDGVILEGFLRHVHREIDAAAADKDVKAVVLRINSPGGSVTASEDLHHRLVELRDGSPRKKTSPKPLVVSMGSLAASGGYYVAMPAQSLFAEPTTVTGSIGVFVSLPNVTGFLSEHKVEFITIKQGEIKDSGSPFKEMTPKERQVWQDLVDHSYERFLAVIEQGRPELTKARLLESFEVRPVHAGPHPADAPPPKKYARYRADGGIYTADKALELKLIDHLGTLDDAVQAAHDAAQLSERYQVIEYERPASLREALLGVRSPTLGDGVLDAGRLKNGLAPRLWYLAPGYELSGVLAAAESPR